MTTQEIIKRAIPVAQRKAKDKRWQIGDVICHPNYSITCIVIAEADNGLIEIGWDGVNWVVPADECFDPNVCRVAALNIKFGCPEDNEGILI